ncbi:MAG: hypothetical protein M0Z38_04335 [Deltaproteobacteria bacterium]|nr:hypothetical protein [Deltaproteobacteria bacterium]
METKAYTLENDIRVWKKYDATGRDLHVDVPMSQAIMNYRTEGLVGEFIFSVVPVSKQTNLIPFFPLGEFLRKESCERAPGTEANIVRFNVGTMAYACKNYALRFPMTIEDRENADEVWQVRQNGAYLITDLIRISKEVRVFNTVNSTSNVSTAFVPASAWNAAANAGNAYIHLTNALNQTQDITGYRPNKLVFGKTAWRTFIQNSAIAGKLFPHGGGVPTLDQARALLDVDEVRVADGYYNTGAEGQTASLSKFFDDAVLGFYQPTGQGQLGPKPRYAATLRWSVPGIPNMAVEALPYDAYKKAEFIEVGVYDDEKVLDKKLAFIFKGVNSAQ